MKPAQLTIDVLSKRLEDAPEVRKLTKRMLNEDYLTHERISISERNIEFCSVHEQTKGMTFKINNN